MKNSDAVKDVEGLLPWNATTLAKFNNSLYLPYYLRRVFLYAFRFDAYKKVRLTVGLTFTIYRIFLFRFLIFPVKI